ncbi:hypothetical protein WUBG_15702 [Wuchereria bancrofti]|uniref:Uncharacterized protein n=1 Tax=Wuchereria bancrofti TaxID=6293 RepID=J9DUL0_WUCBA|nr:hypothetical protein WUBG_15702 [Wuchereria bancrofti]
MDGDTVIDIVTRTANNRNRRNTNLALASPRGKLMMMETQRGDDSDPENTKFQYLFDSLQQEFQQQLKLVEQRTCENRNNLLLLIEWLSLDNPTLAANLLLQRDDVIAKRIKGKLLIAPCKSDSLNIKIIEFRGGLISKFEIDRINAALEILAQNQQMNNPVFEQQETSEIWNELGQRGEELTEQLEGTLEEWKAFLQENLEKLLSHWTIIIIGIIIVVISIVLIVFKSDFTLIYSIFNFLCHKGQTHQKVKIIPMEISQAPLSYEPHALPTFSGRECRERRNL